MRTLLFFVCLLLFALNGCKTNQLVGEELQKKLVKQDNELPVFSIEDLEKVPKEDLLFSVKEVSRVDQKLQFSVQYSGGCVDPHQFELATDGVISDQGVMNFYLLHKTHDDYCKALIMKDLAFDVSAIYDLKSKLLTSIMVNEIYPIQL